MPTFKSKREQIEALLSQWKVSSDDRILDVVARNIGELEDLIISVTCPPRLEGYNESPGWLS